MQWNLPNLILIAGDGRNVGKTTFAMHIISHLSAKTEVTGIKTSPHIHRTGEDLEIIYRTPNFVVAEEKGSGRKDSSLLLKAGARPVFFIMAKQEFLEQAFAVIADKLSHNVVVAESGGLSELIAPGLFFFVRNQTGPVTKEQYLKYKPIIVTNGKQGFDFDVQRLNLKNNHFTLS